MIEAILFDLGKVLIDFDIQIALEGLSRRSALARPEFERLMRSTPWIEQFERGEITTERFHGLLSEHAGYRAPMPEFLEAWSAIFSPGLMVSAGLLPYLKSLYRMVLVSNTNAAHVEFIRRRYGLFEHFHRTVFSHEVHSLKPESLIFEIAIDAAGKPPEALFYTDDREENVAAARRFGIHALRFESEAGLVAAMEQEGIEIRGFM